MPRKKKKPEEPRNNRPSFHKELKGFDIRVNPFGQMESTFEIDKINAFLNEQVADKKLDPSEEEIEKEEKENKIKKSR